MLVRSHEERTVGREAERGCPGVVHVGHVVADGDALECERGQRRGRVEPGVAAAARDQGEAVRRKAGKAGGK